MCVNNTLNSFGAQRFRRVQKTIQIGQLQSLSKVYEVHYAVHPKEKCKEKCCSNRQHSHMHWDMQVIGGGSRDSRQHFGRHPSTTTWPIPITGQGPIQKTPNQLYLNSFAMQGLSSCGVQGIQSAITHTEKQQWPSCRRRMYLDMCC